MGRESSLEEVEPELSSERIMQKELRLPKEDTQLLVKTLPSTNCETSQRHLSWSQFLPHQNGDSSRPHFPEGCCRVKGDNGKESIFKDATLLLMIVLLLTLKLLPELNGEFLTNRDPLKPGMKMGLHMAGPSVSIGLQEKQTTQLSSQWTTSSSVHYFCGQLGLVPIQLDEGPGLLRATVPLQTNCFYCKTSVGSHHSATQIQVQEPHLLFMT